MYFQLLMLILGLVVLTSCHEVSSNHRLGSVPNTPSLNTDNTIVSQIHRTRGEFTITYAEEIQRVITNQTSLTYRQVPELDLDSEGGVNVLSVQKIGRPSITCGNLSEDQMNGVNARISDCKNKNATIPNSTYLWDGSENGAAGEGLWQLVSLTSAQKEIWKDIKTGMVWSEERPAGNWCQASGNREFGSRVDCSVEVTSLCVGFKSAWLGDDVSWRLPTRNDYLQADLNGLRLVFSEGQTVKTYWTATLDSENDYNAWAYTLPQGQVTSVPLNSEQYVRCIGAPRP